MLRWFRRRYVTVIILSRLIALMFVTLYATHILPWPLVGQSPSPPPAKIIDGRALPSSATIEYFGRWDKHDPLTYVSYWGGAYFKTAFTGRHVQIQLAAPASLYVSIDGGKDVSLRAGKGMSSLLVAPLAAGRHTLRVTAGSEATTMTFQGLLLDQDASSLAPQVSPLTIEFIGDSITAGFTDTQGDLSSYAWLSAEALGMEHTQIASSGICLMVTASCKGMQTQFFMLQPAREGSTPWLEDKEQPPDVIVINLGTNDQGQGQLAAAFEVAYINFIRKIWQSCPHASIYAMRTFSGAMEMPTRNAVSLLNAAGAARVFYIDTTGWLIPDSSDFNDYIHPSDAGQQKVAIRLANVLRSMIRII